MKNYAVFLVLLIFLVSCGITGEDVISDTKSTAAHEHEEFQGTFSSKKGVMHPISCYGYNIGFLKTDAGETIITCFDKLSNGRELEIPSQAIAVKGHFVTMTIEEVPDNPCESGTRKIFYVDEWRTL